MIGSIWASLSAADQRQDGITRATLVRALVPGALALGIGMTTAQALAAPRRRVAPVTDMDRFYDAWQDRFNAADVEGMVDLYVADVTYINPEGRTLTGRDAVRADFVGMFAAKPRIELGDRRHILHRDVALTTNHWTLWMKDDKGVEQKLTGGGIEVVRRQADGG